MKLKYISTANNLKQLISRATIFCVAMSFILSSCKKFVTVGVPQTSLTTSTVFSSDATATSAISNIYVAMTQYYTSFSSGETSFTDIAGLCADEFVNYSTYNDLGQFAANQLLASNQSIRQNWNELYGLIYSANSVIEGLNKSQAITLSVKSQLLGEAKFMRAFCFFYLVNAWGNVPLTITTDYKTNSHIPRVDLNQVYAQIISDLKDAKSLLSDSYVTNERIRPNRFTAKSLLARVYLYMGNWAGAESEASDVINSGSYTLEPNLNNVFLKASREAIWQLQSIIPYINVWDGYTFVLTSDPTNVALSSQLLNSFEANDNRKAQWTNSYTNGTTTWYYPYKYKVRTLPSSSAPKTEYLVVFRLAEQYLIRAEARAHQGNITQGLQDLNQIRTRAGVGNSSAADQAQLLSAIEQERKIEFFAEWGHRWLDLKRTGRSTTILGPIKSPNWQATDVLFPIPQDEMNKNNLLSQNPGY